MPVCPHIYAMVEYRQVWPLLRGALLEALLNFYENTHTVVLFAAALSLLAGAPIVADGDDLPGSLSGSLPGKPKYPRLDSQLNSLAAQAAQSGQGGGDVITTSALMYSGSSVAVTVRLTSGSDAIAAFITAGGGIAANVGEDYIEPHRRGRQDRGYRPRIRGIRRAHGHRASFDGGGTMLYLHRRIHIQYCRLRER